MTSFFAGKPGGPNVPVGRNHYNPQNNAQDGEPDKLIHIIGPPNSDEEEKPVEDTSQTLERIRQERIQQYIEQVQRELKNSQGSKLTLEDAKLMINKVRTESHKSHRSNPEHCHDNLDNFS